MSGIENMMGLILFLWIVGAAAVAASMISADKPR